MDIKILKFNCKKFFIKNKNIFYNFFIVNNLYKKEASFSREAQDIIIKPFYFKKFFNKFVLKIEPFANKFSYNDLEQVFKLIDCLKKIHTTKINNYFLKNDYLDNNQKYSPENIWSSLFNKKVLLTFKKPDIKKIESVKGGLLKKASDVIDGQTVLIHGDLNPSNILVFKDKVKIIDWEDARQDNPFLDIAQTIFYAQKNKKESEKMLKRYNKNKSIEELLYFIFLNVLWCLIHKKEYKLYKKVVNFWIKEIKEFNFLEKNT